MLYDLTPSEKNPIHAHVKVLSTGRTFLIKKPGPAAMLILRGALPTPDLLEIEDSDERRAQLEAAAEKMTPRQREDLQRRTADYVCACVVEPRLTTDPEKAAKGALFWDELSSDEFTCLTAAVNDWAKGSGEAVRPTSPAGSGTI